MRTAASLITTIADEDLVRRVLDGEVLLFEVVMRRNDQRLYRVVRAILGNDAEVEDVLQEAYLKAYKELLSNVVDWPVMIRRPPLVWSRLVE